MSMVDNHKGLRFACECVSAIGGYSDPWAGVAQKKLLPDGTKEQILNVVAREPKTIAQLAKELGISQPSVHAHIGELLVSELLRESEEWEKRYPTERYYEPNFPVVKAEERAELEALCRETAERFASLFEKQQKRLERAFDQTNLGEQGWTFPELTQYLYAKVQRTARSLLEEQGVLAPRRMHRNGVAWVFWAEEEEGSPPTK
ncbi:MAG TPA: winged helix-turn-helix domain-containing protein [Pyrinomonadaceae bacterium]|jgi:DNA-binding transcriptional ArsR family regulator|nr:winged helix-turn-helix domain-containing protein [Pyrinomonadaceae bacterium]